jgi:uncharacterized protein
MTIFKRQEPFVTDTTTHTFIANRGPVQPTDTASTVLRPGTRGRITTGLWRDSRWTNAVVSIPDGWDRLVEAGNIHNLELAAGTTTGDYRNDLPFMDSDLYKWLEAVGCLLGGNDPDARTRERLMAHIDTSVAVLTAAQQDDGYLNSYVQVIRPDKRWQHLDWGHEHYSAGHLIQAAVAVARGTGRSDLLEIACRLADRIDADFGTGPGKIDGIDGHPEIEMALVELYRVTGERRYLDLARYFVDRRGHGLLSVARYTDRNFGSMYWQDHTPLREATEVGGHAVRQLYLLSGAVDVYAETGDRSLLEAAERLWEEMVATQTYLTGGVGAHHLDESFGDQYELPNERAYTETCAAIASVMLSWRLLLATGNVRYADLIERTLYNCLLAGVSLRGDKYLYVNPLQRRDSHALRDGGDMRAERTPWFRCACCPPNIMRTLASLEHYVIAADDMSVVLHQYISGSFEARIAAGTVSLVVQTGLPWTGSVTVAVNGPAGEAWTLTLRVPAWSPRARVTVNGAAVSDQPQDGWLRISRDWAPGDIVTVELDMEVRVVTADPRVDTARGAVALERGPLVYCLEAVDQSEGFRLDDVVIDAAGPTSVDQRPDLLGGVVAITARGRRRPGGPTSGWWPYRGVGTANQPGAEVELTAVPYYAWANRDPGAMRVWIPTV